MAGRSRRTGPEAGASRRRSHMANAGSARRETPSGECVEAWCARSRRGGRLPARADPAQRQAQLRNLNGGCGQSSAARVSRFFGAKRRAMRLFGALPVRGPVPISVRHAINEGRSLLRACSIAAAMASGSCPSIRQRPTRSLNRVNWSSEQDRDVAPSIESRCRRTGQSASKGRCPPAKSLVAETLHQAAVAGDDVV